MRSLQRAFRKQNAVIAENADRDALNMSEAGDERRTIQRLELIEFGAIDQTRDHLTHIVLPLELDRHDAVELAGVVFRLCRLGERNVDRLFSVQPGDDLAA